MEEKCIVVTDLLLKDENNKYLFCIKKDDRYYQLPGGHLPPKKGIYDSIVFFAKKQLDIDIDIDKLSIIHIMEYPERRKIFFTLEYKYNGELIDLEKSSHYNEYEWFENNEDLIIDDKLKQVMKNVLNNNLYSEYYQGREEHV